MKSASVALLDAVRARHGLTSDYQLCKLLDVPQNRVSNYRHGRAGMDDEMGLRIAALLGRPAGAVLAELAADRAKVPAVAKAWKEAARRLAQTAAVASMALGMCLLLGDPVSRAYAASGAPAGAALHNHARAASDLHIMRSVRAWIARALAALKARRARP